MVVSLWFLLRIFPSFPNKGFMGFYIEQVHIDDDFCPSIFQMGVSGFISHSAIQNKILSIGIPYWLEGSV
jgi:hypothetical protein